MKNLKIITLLLFLLFNFNILYSQFENQIKESLTYKPQPTFRYDNRNSIISNWGARISSIKLGLDYNKVITFGGGYEWLASDIKRKKYIKINNLITDTVNSYLKLNYVSAYTEYLFYNDKHWEFSLPIILGAGIAKYRYNYNSINYTENASFVLIYETNMIAHYKIIPWVGVGAGVGYRLMIKGNNMLQENFNSPIYILKVKIYFGRIYNDLKK